jgi:7-cyano-7-deazaguanine synthase in queuosine biosynthesis
LSSGKRIAGDVGILLSGGIDSVTLMFHAEEQQRLRAAWFVDYGQGAVSKEREIASRWICELGLVGHALVLPIAGHVAMLNEPGAEGLRVVPGRNLVLLSTVATWAAANSIRELWYGATVDDRDYPDCAPSFVYELNGLLRHVGVTVRAPWLELGYDKRAVVARARELKVPFARTWSCYTPRDTGKPCQTCSACRRRAVALGSGIDANET